MFHLQKATHVTSNDGRPGDDTLLWLAHQYAYPPRATTGSGPATPFVRANMVSSIDGAVTVEGRSGGLGGDGDKALFRVLRGLADVILVGAGTATTEDYGQPQPDAVFAALRDADGQQPAPVLALVSKSLSVPPDYAPVTHPQTVVFTCRDAPADRRRALTDAGATLIDCGDDTVDIAAVLARCVERGWSRVLCEGGPSLLGSVAGADALDELCLTTSPFFVGGTARRIAVSHPGTETPALRSMQPASIITDDDGFVFTRWRRADRHP
ncbi:pyrimidine reductase family protein [Gordonia sp. 'Campus']|uniref:pyrimidine reductase family protein n=1 Tax=Gordonia sp. 'Campus' TaxID=2915824 RepID=UPI001EE43A7E|nr:pyrimidine reductase family protein [Gordonia sp. 'Campus']